MVEKIKSTLRHPVTQRLGGLSIGAILTFAIVLGGYKANFDTMAEDVRIIKPVIQQLQLDVAVIKNQLKLNQ